MKNSLLLYLLFIICSCNAPTNNNTDISEQKMVTNDWKKDKYGCLKLRSKELAEKLIIEHKLKKKLQNDFLQIFGEPNEIKKEENQQILTYYFDTVCNEGKLEQDGEKCYANYYFHKNQLVKEDYICE